MTMSCSTVLMGGEIWRRKPWKVNLEPEGWRPRACKTNSLTHLLAISSRYVPSSFSTVLQTAEDRSGFAASSWMAYGCVLVRVVSVSGTLWYTYMYTGNILDPASSWLMIMHGNTPLNFRLIDISTTSWLFKNYYYSSLDHRSGRRKWVFDTKRQGNNLRTSSWFVVHQSYTHTKNTSNFAPSRRFNRH
jgi:hypothetical protein